MARMPSTRRLPQTPAQGFVPVVAPKPVVVQAPARVAVSAPVVAPEPAVALAPAVAPGQAVVVVAPEVDETEAAATRAGGFHESSYELRLGLEVSESAWPDDALPRDWPATR